MDILAKIGGLHPEEILDILKKDMKKREVNTFEHYFSDILIVLQKSRKQNLGEKKGKKGGEEFTAGIANLKKDSYGLLFNFDDSLSQILSGFTIDMRVFFNLLRKMIIIKLNHDRIWTRQFYSEDLKLIYLVMKPLDTVFENRAMVATSNVGRRLPQGNRAGFHRSFVPRGSR